MQTSRPAYFVAVAQLVHKGNGCDLRQLNIHGSIDCS